MQPTHVTARRSAPWPRLSLILVLGGLWLGVTAFLAWDQRQELATGSRQATTLSESLASHAEQVLTDAERLAQIIEHEVRRFGITTAVDAFLESQPDEDRLILQLALVDTDGFLRSSTIAGWQPVDLSDREHIRIHHQDQAPALFISKPLVGRASGRLSVQLSRRLQGPDGEFLGILVISIDPTQLTERYRKLDIGPHGVIALIGTQDGVVRLVRSQMALPRFHAGAGDGTLLATLTSGNGHTPEAAAKPWLGTHERLIRLTVVPHYPLAVMVALSEQDLLAPHRLRRNLLILACALLTLLALVAELGRQRLLQRARLTDQQLLQALATVGRRERRLAALFRAIPDPALAFSAATRAATGCNPPMARLLNLPEGEADHLSLPAFATQVFQRDVSSQRQQRSDILQKRIQAALARGNAANPERFEIHLDTPAPVIYEVRLETLHDAPSGLLVLLRDITAQHRLERMTNDFAATAAHEMRTPLASILGLGELLAADLVPEGRRPEVAEQIRNRAQNMAELVNDLLTLTRLETGRGGGKCRQFDLRNIADDMLHQLPEARDRLAITLPDTAILVQGNQAELVTALRNGVENALKYDNSGRPVKVTLWTNADNQQARVEIRDHGPGVPAADIERVFERFVRLESTQRLEGSGLGLPLIRSILQHHGGWAWIESGEGTGLALQLSLPLTSPLKPDSDSTRS